VTAKFKKRIEKRKKKIAERLINDGAIGHQPVMSANLIRYELSEKIDATCYGGIGVIHKMNQMLKLPELINAKLHLLAAHKPYFESDHVLNMVYNIVAGGKCLEDLELRRTDTAYMTTLGAKRIPDPTTAGDFLRRFEAESETNILFEISNEYTRRVWSVSGNGKKRKQARLCIDGKIVETLGKYKEKMDMSYKGMWGFSTLILTEMTTGVHIFCINRGGNILSQEEATYWIKKAIEILKEYFDEILIEGDSAYYLTEMLDDLEMDGVKFCFAVDQLKNLIKTAENIDENEWVLIQRIEQDVKKREHKKKNIKELKIIERNYKHVVQREEHVSEYFYTPTNCKNQYRIIVVRQLKEIMTGGLFNYYYYQYRFAITNLKETESSTLECLDLIRKRANHENKIEQLESGVFALNMPTKEFYANQAYMTIIAMAWNMKSYLGLLCPDGTLGEKIISMEFKNFKQCFINIPTQIYEQGRYIVYRLLGFNQYIENLMQTFEHICKLEFG
jgi:predicted peroxiredoxin